MRNIKTDHESIFAILAKQLDITVAAAVARFRPTADTQRMGCQDELTIQRLSLDRFQSALQR